MILPNHYIYIYELGDDADDGFPYYGANFWEDWERPAHFSLFNSDGELEIEFKGNCVKKDIKERAF